VNEETRMSKTFDVTLQLHFGLVPFLFCYYGAAGMLYQNLASQGPVITLIAPKMQKAQEGSN